MRSGDELGVPIIIHVSGAPTSSSVARGTRRTPCLSAHRPLGATVASPEWADSREIKTSPRARPAWCIVPIESDARLGVAPIVEMGKREWKGSRNDGPRIEQQLDSSRAGQRRASKVPGRPEDQCREVLRLGTIGGARCSACGQNRELERGKRADVVIIDSRARSRQPVYSVESAIVTRHRKRVVTTIVTERS